MSPDPVAHALGRVRAAGYASVTVLPDEDIGLT